MEGSSSLHCDSGYDFSLSRDLARPGDYMVK